MLTETPSDLLELGSGDSARTSWLGSVAAAVLGAVALMAAFALAGGLTTELLTSYLTGYVFFATVALGGLFFVMVHHVTRAAWGVPVRRLAEQVAMLLLPLAVLFVPLAVALPRLYEWAAPDALVDPLLAHKSAFLDPARFVISSALYFAVWIALAAWFRRRSLLQDGGIASAARMRQVAAPGLLLFALTLTFASFDWLMSLQPHWYSTIFGVYVFAGCAVAGFAFLILAAVAFQRGGRLEGVVSVEHYHDLGKLLFAFACFWAYIAFSQFMLIWYAALPEETAFYGVRLAGGWQRVGVALVIAHFAVPFLFLMSRHVKRRPRLLAVGATWLLIAHYVDIVWLVQPVHRQQPGFGWLDLLTLIGLGGVLLGVFLELCRRSPLVATGDPRLDEALQHDYL